MIVKKNGKIVGKKVQLHSLSCSNIVLFSAFPLSVSSASISVFFLASLASLACIELGWLRGLNRQEGTLTGVAPLSLKHFLSLLLSL
jgi:hypothetical protein